MITGEDEPSSGLNGRLRPRKSNASPKTTKALRKLDAKPLNEKPKRTGTPSKASPNKPDDFLNKSESDVSPISQVLCSYCDKIFVSRQAAGKHTRRVHTSTSKQDYFIHCLFCNHAEIEPNDIIRHMVDSHPNQYFACLNCHSRFSSTSELAEHKLNVCEKQKPHYRNKLRQPTSKENKTRKIDGRNEFRTDDKKFPEDIGFNGIVISCELKPARVHDEADIEDNITTNVILPPSKNVGNATVIEKNAVIVLDDLQWNKRIPPNFNFHNTDADQILSRLGVVHRAPRTGEPNRRDWLKIIDETNQKFERCFDTTFYTKVASNVQENLAKFLDGSFNFNPDPDNTIKTRKSKNSVAINTAEGFPILLAFEQYSRNVFDGYLPRSIAPKHKWKWDNLEHDKTLLSPEQIKRDSHANNCIITLVSSLDIWTQLCMRQKFEDKFKSSPLEKKAEKQSIIGKELKEILEKRELPPTSSQVAKYVNPTSMKRDDLEFPASLGLAPSTPNHDFKPAVLSGEWVRPRCYICCACGYQARDSKALSSHITNQHPNAQIQHYEIVGDVLLNSDISKHLYVPPSQINNRTRPLRGFRDCTKCTKSITLEDLHQHMLDCAGDTPAVRRKCRTARPFGVRKRRPRLPDNTIRKKIRKDIRSRHRKNLIRPRQKNRSDVGDAETIRKMLADLPAKRHRVLVNPLNSNLRPRRKFDKQRSIIKMKKKISEDGNRKGQPYNTVSHVNTGNERLNKKIPNLKEGDIRMVKCNIEQLPTINRHKNAIKKRSPIGKNKKNLRFRESKGVNDSGGEGKKCSDSGKKSDGNQSGSSGGNFNRNNAGEGSYNSREHGNRSDGNSNERDNQQPGCSRQNDDSRDSSDQSPSVPLKHSIAQLTANSETHDKSVQFHHLFLVQQECNNIPQHVPSRQNILFENEAVVTKLDKPPLHINHGGTMDPLGQKCKTNKPRKGLNDCIAMLKNKLVDPIQSSQQVSIQCYSEEPSSSNFKTNDAKNDKQNQLTKKPTPKITHEIAVQCADLDDRDTLADALLKEQRRRQGIPSTSQNDKGKGKAFKQRNDKLTKDTNDINNHGSIKNKAADPKPTIEKEFQAQPSTSGLQKPVSRSFTKGDLKHIKKSREIIPIPHAQGKMEAQQATTTNNQNSVISDVTKCTLKNIKESQDNLPANNTHEIFMAQNNTSRIQQIVPPDSSKGSLKSTKKMESATPKIQEKIEPKQSTTSNQKSVFSEGVQSSTRNIKKYQDNLQVTHTQQKVNSQQNTTNFQQSASSDTKASLRNVKKSQNIIPVTSTQEKNDAQKNITSSHQSVPSNISEDSFKNLKKGPDSVPQIQEKSEPSPCTSSTKYSVSSNITKGSLKNIKKNQDTVPVTYTQEIMNSQSPTTVQQCVPSDGTKSFLKNIKINQDNAAVNNTQEKPNVSKNTNNNQQFVSSISTKGSLKNMTKCQDTIPIIYTNKTSDAQPNSTSNQKYVSTEVVNKGSLKNAKKGKIINSVSYTQEKCETQSLRQSTALHSVQQSDSSIVAKASMGNYKKAQDIIPITQAHEKSEAEQNITRTLQSVPSNVVKGYLKNIKKGPDIVPIAHTQEKMDAQQCTTYQQSISPDGTKVSLVNIRKSQDIIPATQPSNLDTSSSEKYIDSIPKNIKERKKSDSISPNISNRAHEKIDSKSSSLKQDIIRLEMEKKKVKLIQTKKQNEYDKLHLLVGHSPTETVNKTFVTYEQHKIINVGNVNMNIDDNVYNSEPGPHDRTIQNLCQDTSINEHSVINTDIQPAHCNIQIESMLTAPLDLSGKISSTQLDSPFSYTMPMYENYETLDLSNKNPNRNVIQNTDFIDEDVVDLRIKYTSTIHYESDLSNSSSIPDVATDLSIGNGQIPKDLSLKGRNRILSRASTVTHNECINIASGRSHYNSCSSDIYEENACLDFSLKENLHTNNPTDLTGRRDSRIQHIDSNLSGIESRVLEHIEMHEPEMATNLSVCNRMNLHASVNSYEPLHIITGEMTSHLNRNIVNPTIISTDIAIVSNDIYTPVSKVLLHKRPEECDNPQLSPEIEVIDTGITLITSKESSREHLISVIANTSTYMDASVINQIPIYTKEQISPYPFTNTPLCLSETITTSLPAYNFKNRTLVTPSSKYESTTPVYTLANACISVTKIESTSSATLTNMLLSIPGNTITNTTSVYTLAGTTIGTPINYNAGSNALSINSETSPSFKTADNITELLQNPDAISLDEPITIISQEKEKVDDVRETKGERVGTNLDQDPDIAKKIALLPKELVEILGTMPLDHRKQLLNVLPQYVSTSTAAPGPSTDYGKELITKSKDQRVSPLPDRNNTRQTKIDVTLEKRHNMLNPTPPPSTLSHSVSQLSPSSVSSSFLLTPPTPNFKTRSLNTTYKDYTDSSQISPEKDATMFANNEFTLSKISTNTDEKVIDLCNPVIDLTGDDNSQSTPEEEVHTTSEASVQSVSPKPVTSFTAVKGVALKTNNDKTASLRAVRIKTQSERHKTAFPNSQTRKESTEIPVTSSNPDDMKISLNNNKSLTIQQGEITSTQQSNRHIVTEDHISSSVSINDELFEQKNDHDTPTKKNGSNILIEPKAVLENSYEVSSEMTKHTKTENACSTNFVNDDFVYKGTKLENSACATTAVSPVQSEKIISNNNNVVPCKYASEHKIKTKEPDVNPKDNRKTSEDDDSDDDVSLAAIVKQRDSDKTVDKNNTKSVATKLEKSKCNADQIVSLVPSVKGTDISIGVISTEINNSEQFISQLPTISVDQTHNDKINIEAKDKNKKKGRKGRRSNILNVPKNVEQTTNDDEFDINKENTVTSDSENIKYKDENVKLKTFELDSACISSCNNAKELINTNQSYKDNTEVRDERNLVGRDISVCDSSKTDTSKSIDEANEQERVILLTYDQTLNKNSTNKPKHDNLIRHDTNLQKLPLIPRVVTKKIELKSPVNNIIKENTDTDVVDPNKKITFTCTAENSSENLHVLNKIETTSVEETTVTPLRRSRRGKSLFIDNNMIAKDSPSSSDIVLEHKMPLTKKQLIFSKLLLDEEHNGPSVPSNIENIEKNDKAETKQIVKNDDGNGTVIQNDATDSDVDQQTSLSLIKTNKRKKSSQIKKKNKKKKLLQFSSSVNENTDLNLSLGNNTILKDSVKTLSIANSHSGLRKSSECSSETQKQEQIQLDKSKELNKEVDFDSISSQERASQKKSGSIEKRKPDISTDIDALASSKPKKSKGYDDIINQDEIGSKKVLLKPDTTVSEYKAKARTLTCYNKPVAARRARSKSVFVNSSVPEYYDPYDIDFEEMNEISETVNRKIALRKASYTSKTPNSTITSTSNKSEIDNNGLSECYDAVPSTSKNVTISLVPLQKNEWLQEIDYKKLNTSKSTNKEITSDSDDSSKSDIPLKKYVEEKEKKMLDSNENVKKLKNTNDLNTSGNIRTRKKNKRGSVTNKKADDSKTQSSENEAQLRSEKFMESFGFFSERKPRKSNLLATKKITETLNKIANETDDVYFGIKERSSKRTAEKRQVEEENNRATTSKESKQDKKAAKRSRKKKSITFIECTYCQICKKEFRRSDNYLRHQMSILHISKILEVELNVKTTPVEEEPNYLIAYKLQLDRVKILHDKIAKRKKHSLPTNDIVLPTVEEILANVKSTIREQQHYCRGLSRDEVLFIDCCELLKESHNKNVRRPEKVRNSLNGTQASAHELEIFVRNFEDRIDDRSDGDVDSITARNIMESDEVRNLENDLISGLKEAANANKFNENHLNFHNLNEILRPDTITIQPSCSSVNTNYNHVEKQDKVEESKVKPKRSPEYKEKMYPDIIENIDMFEDKFDKIKRKCRSQAAAASKQSQAVPEASSSHKVRKNKKKGKKKTKSHQSTVMTKGALKGFEGIKVSIVTTEINMSAIMPPLKKSSKKMKKNQSKKKREKKSTDMNTRTSHNGSDEPQQKKLDVYEFMDTDDAEVFDFRPSTIMERFKSISNKDIPSTSKNIGKYNEVDVSSDSASDGDDFVYMSDDYVCSEDETENSIMSCELRNVNEPKKSSPFKRKDATEKSAVMGKIFKNNAVRSEKKNPKNKDIDKPKANLDQLFDSLLEEQPHSSKYVNETITSQTSELSLQRYCKSTSPKQSNKSDFYEYDDDSHHDDEDVFKKSNKLSTSEDTDVRSFNSGRVVLTSKKRLSVTPPKKCNISPIKYTNEDHIKNNNNKHKDSDIYTQLSLKKYDQSTSNDPVPKFSRRKDIAPSPELFEESNDDFNYNAYKSKDKCQENIKIKSSFKLHEKERRVSFGCHAESLDEMNLSDDGGVARQRVRRKCTVGKQNILAETWSSESEPDGMPPRPNSAESVVVGGGRRRKGRKKESHASGNKKGNSKIPRKNDFESRVNTKSRNASSSEVIECNAGGSRSGVVARSSGGFARPGQSLISHGGTSNSSSAKSRPRPAPYYWSEGDDEQEHLQQHGWIVGDSHKKLVTMLAHAKGRKRNNDEKRHVVE